ncbi:MAG: response regulator [Bacteroidetes bacterium]|nr:MAG: response regulator [Bacteroidota bacterium]
MTSKKILLAEDDLNDLELMRTALKEIQLERQLEIARNGEEALDYLYRRNTFTQRKAEAPALVVLDLKMPRVCGFEVLHTLKSDDSLKYIPAVVFTSSKEERDIRKCYQLGANAYVVKPVDFGRFLDVVQLMIQFWLNTNETPPHESGIHF